LSLRAHGCWAHYRGSATSRIVGRNVANDDRFYPTVNMWVYEEVVNGRKLSSIINEKHENVKYGGRRKGRDPRIAAL